MTNDNNLDTYERWIGPVRCVIQRGHQVPLLPPRLGETQPFASVWEPDEVVSMDVDGRPVESVTVRMLDGRGQRVVKWKDGGETVYDHGEIRGDHS